VAVPESLDEDVICIKRNFGYYSHYISVLALVSLIRHKPMEAALFYYELIGLSLARTA
jgi:hypothetical protein